MHKEKSIQTRLAALALLVLVASGADRLEAVSIEVGSVNLGATNGSTGFRTVNFSSSVFDDNGLDPLVFVVPTTQGAHPCQFRFDNITRTSFDVACVEPPGDNGPHNAMTLHYIAIEAGVHTVPATIGGSSTNVVFAAGTVSTTAVQHNCSSGCGSQGSTAITFGTTFSSAPALLLEVQTDNSESGTPPGGVSQPFLSATVVETTGGSPDITTTGARIALERSEVQQGTVSAETIAWLAVEATLSGGSPACATLDFSGVGGPSSVAFQAVITGEVIDGWSDGCNAGEGASFVSGCFSSAPIVVASRRGRNGTDGGWLRRCTTGFTATAVRFTNDEDRNRDSERNHVDEAASVLAFDSAFSTPVTLAWFRATETAAGTRFEWETATEVGNVGFLLWVEVGEAWLPVSERLIPSRVVDSEAPQRYVHEAPGLFGQRFRLTDVDVRGRKTDHGPFELGRGHGARPHGESIDWQAVRAGREARARQRRAVAHVPLGRTAGGRGPSAATDVPTDRGRPDRATARRRLLGEIRLSTAGLYRVGWEDLAAAGIALQRLDPASLALTRQGVPQRIRVVPGPSRGLGPGGFLEFYGLPVDGSLYTRTSVYRLWIDPSRARRVGEDPRPVPGGEAATTYLETVEIDRNMAYSLSAPGADPWYEVRLLSYGEPVSRTFEVEVDHLVGGAAGLRARFWGTTNLPTAPDHHAVLSLNGSEIWRDSFDGFEEVQVEVDLPPGLLVEGTNLLEVSLPGDTGAPFELVNVDRYSVRYRRGLVAAGGALEFAGRAAAFEVRALPSASVLVYSLARQWPGQLARLLEAETTAAADGWVARFRGDPINDSGYLVWDASQPLQPDEIRAASPVRLDREPADFIIIAHGDFVDGLAPLAARRRAAGISTKIIDVADLYAAFSHGVVDPEAVRRYVGWAARRLGARYVLLVGADTYDYFDYLGLGSISFVPTPYARTADNVGFAPADPLLADIDGDRLPDLPIGRLPVRTPEELAITSDKILAYEGGRVAGTAVFVADGTEVEGPFGRMSDGLIEQLADGWSFEKVHLDELELDAAREALLGRLEEGVGLVSFVGHSGPTRWTFDGLFTATDAVALTNSEPTVVIQGGCWNTYHVTPRFNTMAHELLMSGSHGAAAVLGASTLTRVRSESQLTPRIIDLATRPGVLLGDAVQGAKVELATERPDLVDVLIGWTLLGDPTMALWP